MATYSIARDGHPYLIHGYPVVDHCGGENCRFCTYQLNPRAEHLFEKASFEEGDSVSRETFYALLVEGSIYNDARPSGAPITAVPMRVLLEAQTHLLLGSADNRAAIEHAQFLVNVFEVVARDYGATAEALSVSSWFCLLRRLQARRL